MLTESLAMAQTGGASEPLWTTIDNLPPDQWDNLAGKLADAACDSRRRPVRSSFSIELRSLRSVAIALVTAIIGSSGGALADEGLGINGGVLAHVNSHHVEFIGGAGYDLVMFAISDLAQKPLPLSGTSAVATIELSGRKKQILLESDDGGILSAKAGVPLKSGVTITLSATLASGEMVLARFKSR